MSTGNETVIGLEIHVQLKTASKMFCGCRAEFGAEPNTNVCPVCLGLPGALPVVNRRAVELGVAAASALGCELHPLSRFARKNYFYPDLPKGYQISQYDRPLASHGRFDLPAGDGGSGRRVRVRRLHLEEDSGKSLHDRFPGSTAVDLNRAGVPLAEIVTEPDLRAPWEARAFLVRLKRMLEYLEVSDCNMEEGSLRVDANVSVRAAGGDTLSTKTELKNMNSFSQLERALGYEAERQVAILSSGGGVEPQTLLWDPTRNEARPMRGKEEVHDYRYFPEPDLPELRLPELLIQRIAAQIPELPWEKRARLESEYGLLGSDAEVLTAARGLADFYEAVVAAGAAARPAANWVTGTVLEICNDLGRAVSELELTPERLAGLIAMVEDGTLSHWLGRAVLRKMVESGRDAERVVAEEGLRKVSDSEQLEGWVLEAMSESPNEVERFRAGEQKLLTYFIGQVMQKSKGKADPGRTREIVLRSLGRGE